MNIEWSEGAFNDYDEIINYIINGFGLRAARDFKTKLLENINVLSKQPFAGKEEYTNPNTLIVYRSLSCKQYSIVYTLVGEKLIIVSFWNNRKNPDTLREMLEK
jgi:plasmid stabilization system protein ParE